MLKKNVVINNVIHSLKKLSSRKSIAIRVNLADLDLTTQYKEKFIKIAETDNIKILEDTTVDKGGCIIETDFGTLDARISSQLHEIEEKVQEMVPLQVKTEEPKSEDRQQILSLERTRSRPSAPPEATPRSVHSAVSSQTSATPRPERSRRSRFSPLQRTQQTRTTSAVTS